MHGESSEHARQVLEKLQGDDQPCPSDSVHPGITSFVKQDGRQIGVGDCALFKAGQALPYVGIIQRVSTNDEGATQLDVNWLYRPADVKLCKGDFIETAPNEIFYSFHKDSIPAVSLLHPCKVAFLRKGVELPVGISSFVCRRLYDVARKRLWWLTDRDYTDEHQEEVNQLLDRTKLEMQAAVQPGVASPRALAGNTSSQPPKSNSENVPNSSLSNMKNKKRERTDQNLEPSKRERFTRAEDLELLHVKKDGTMKLDDISSIIDNDGGLVSLAGVDNLVSLMQQERNDSPKKVAESMSRRIVLATVISATEKEDCLNRFVQLGGLPMLDDWLQEAHKGKSGNGESPKEGEKSSEDLLLTLLRALDKLPVDLDALKTCIVGKSVNNLRSHKNAEIQKKARRLVEIWKKRVDAEMKHSGDVRSGPQAISWSLRQQPQGIDSLPSHPIKNGGPQEVDLKTTKTMPNGSSCSPESVAKAMIGGSVSVKMLNVLSHNSPVTKDSHHVKPSNGNLLADVSGTSVKEEKSSCSSQIQSFGESWTSGPVKGDMSACWKDDIRNSSAALLNAKGSGLVVKSNGKAVFGQSGPGNQKENFGGKTLFWNRNSLNEKSTLPAVVPEKGATDMAVHFEIPSNQRLIVRLPNPGRSPAQTVSAGSIADSPIPSRGSSPNGQERHASFTPAEIIDGKCRPSRDAQDDASAEVVSDLRSKTSSKGRATDGEAKQSDVLEDTKDSEKSNAEDLGDAIRNCINGKEKHSQNGNQIADGTCGSVATVPKTSTDGSTEAEGSSKGDNATMVTHAMEDILPSADSSTTAVDESAMKVLAVVATTKVVFTGPDRDVGADPGSAKQEKQMTGLTAQVDTFSKNYVHDDQEFRDFAVDNCRQIFRFCDPQVTSSVYLTSKPGETGRYEDNTLSNDPSAFYKKLPSGMRYADGVCESQKDKSISCLSSSSEVNVSKVTLSNVQGCLKESPSHASVDSSGKALHPAEVRPNCGPDKDENTVDNSKVGHSTDERSSSLRSKLERSSRDGENLSSKPDNLTQEVPKRLPDIDRGSVTACLEDVSFEVARRETKKAEQEVQKYNTSPPHGTPLEVESQDGKSVQDITIKKYDAMDLPRSNAFDECMAKLSEEKLASLLGKQVADATENGRKLDKVNSGKHSKSISSNEIRESSTPVGNCYGETCEATDSKASRPNTPCSSQRLGDAGEDMLKQLVFHKVVSSPHDVSFRGSLSESVVASDNLRMEKARCLDALDRPLFDLNEGFEDNMQEVSLAAVVASPLSSNIPMSVSVPTATSSGLTAPIAVVASTNSTFIPPASPMCVKKELGWKGSAATSAFRPAEPRRTPERQQASLENPAALSNCGSGVRQVKHTLYIDLNVADERLMEDMGLPNFSPQGLPVKSGGHVGSAQDGAPISRIRLPMEAQGLGSVGARPDLDLNRIDDNVDGSSDLKTSENKNGSCPSSIPRNIVRDFDLNDGPVPSFEETSNDESAFQHLPAKSIELPVLPQVSGLRMSGELSTVTPWIPPGNSFSAIAIPAFPGTRGGTPYPVAAASHSFLNAGLCVTPYNSEMYRAGAATLSSSSGMAYPTAPPCPYPFSAFPFGGSFPLTASPFTSSSAAIGDPVAVTSFPPLQSQVVTPGAVAPTFVRPPFLMNMSSDGAGADTNGVWGRLNLDLNAGPEAGDTDVASIRHPFILSGQVSVEDQMRAIRQAGAASGTALKRKEPEGGLEAYRSSAQRTWR